MNKNYRNNINRFDNNNIFKSAQIKNFNFEKIV